MFFDLFKFIQKIKLSYGSFDSLQISLTKALFSSMFKWNKSRANYSSNFISWLSNFLSKIIVTMNLQLFLLCNLSHYVFEQRNKRIFSELYCPSLTCNLFADEQRTLKRKTISILSRPWIHHWEYTMNLIIMMPLVFSFAVLIRGSSATGKFTNTVF